MSDADLDLHKQCALTTPTRLALVETKLEQIEKIVGDHTTTLNQIHDWVMQAKGVKLVASLLIAAAGFTTGTLLQKGWHLFR